MSLFHYATISSAKKIRKISSGLVVATAALFSGCSTPMLKPDAEATTGVRIAATPNAAPQRTITNFTQSLRCMDDKLAKYEVAGLLIGAQEVYGNTNEVSGTKDMLLTSLSTMSRKSKAFGIVTLSQDLTDVSKFHSLHGSQAFRAPDFFIRLSTPQIDKGVQTNQAGGGIGVVGAGEFQLSKDRIASVVSLDMNLGTVKNLQLLPGIYSSNSIAVVRKGSATDLSGEIQKLGAVFRVTNDKSEGFHHSVRTLIELGAIEIVGRLTQIPYWECLDIESTNPAVQAQVQDWFEGLNQEERILFTQGKLSALDLYDGSVDGIESGELRRSVARYKKDQGLIADGDIDFLLYYNLIIDRTPVAPQHLALLRRENALPNAIDSEQQFTPLNLANGDSVEDVQVVSTDVASSTSAISLGSDRLVALELSMTTDRGVGDVTYRSGEKVSLQLGVSVDAHVFCYYQQGDGSVIKIFPNRFRQSSLVLSDEVLDVSGGGRFEIRTDKAGQLERIMCFAAPDDIDQKLPSQLRELDLQPLPVKNLEQVHGFYRGVAPTLPLRKTINITVSP